jgi:HEAT repeat protein
MLDELIANLRNPDPLVRVKAVPALADLGAAALEAIPDLLSLTQDESQHLDSLACNPFLSKE